MASFLLHNQFSHCNSREKEVFNDLGSCIKYFINQTKKHRDLFQLKLLNLQQVSILDNRYDIIS